MLRNQKYFLKLNLIYLNHEIKIRKVKNKFKINNNVYDYVLNCTYYQKLFRILQVLFMKLLLL